jgi:hypothetical protein
LESPANLSMKSTLAFFQSESGAIKSKGRIGTRLEMGRNGSGWTRKASARPLWWILEVVGVRVYFFSWWISFLIIMPAQPVVATPHNQLI